MTVDTKLEAQIKEVEQKIKGMDVWDEAGEQEFGRLHVELGNLKAKRSHRITQPDPPGGYSGHRQERGSYVHPAASEFVSLHGLGERKLDNGGFKSFAEFLSVVGSGLHDDRVMSMRAAASSSIGTAGGVLVPEQFIAESLHPPGEAELIMPLARKYSMTAGTLHVSTLNNLSNASGTLYGGFSAEWVAEGESFTEQTPATSKMTLHLNKLGLKTKASNELVSDSDYERELIPALQQALRDFRDEAFFNGNGVGKPKGILNDVAIIEVAKESGQAADTIVIGNLDKMYARLHPRLIRSAKWYVNPTCIPQLLGLVREVGTSGQTVPVMNESSGSFFLYGLPVELTSKLPVLGDAGDILLADVSQYGIGFAREITIAKSVDYSFASDETDWRVIWRGDGQGLWSSVFTPRNGSTLSWCVKLAERA